MGRARVKVVIRARPVASLPANFNLDAAGGSIDIHVPKKDEGAVNNAPERWHFSASNKDFEKILLDATQEEVYNQIAASGVMSVMRGINATILAYGQTGAGKTYSMTGVPNSYTHRGLIPRCLGGIFQEVANHPEKSISVRLSYTEIYNELMFDLLAETGIGQQSGELLIRETDKGRVVVKGLSEILVEDEQEALQVYFAGNSARVVAEHKLNQASSRSHCIFTVHVESRSRMESSERVEYAKLNLVDLAGSERVKKTNSEGVTLKEAAYINKSLSFLEQVVLALSDRNRDHIPYRQAKLTHYLKDSLGGNCETTMLANVWPEARHVEETASTLHFCRRMMKVQNDPSVNFSMDPMLLLKKYERDIEALKLELKMHDTLSGRGIVNYDPGPEEKQEFERMVHGYLRGEVTEQEMFSDKQTIMQTKLMFQIFKEFHERQEQEIRDAEDGDVGFSLGKARDDNRPPGADDEGEEEGRPSPDRFATDGPAPRLDKQELFSTFKETHAQGREIETRFRALKEELKAAKGRVGQLVQEVNKRKRVIDEAEFGLKQVTAQKRSSNASDIIDNDEWEAQKKVRDAKKDYRTQYDLHADQKRMVQDIEAQIAQSKVDLLTQFEHWYSMQYGQMSGDAHDGALHDLQDTGEQFDSMEHDRLEKIHPDGAVPFFKARKDFRAHHSHPSRRR
jgi:kinesin family protein 6/9